MAKRVMTRAAVAVVVAAAAASAVHKNVRRKRLWGDLPASSQLKRTSETTSMGVRHGPHYHRLSQSTARMTVHGGDRRGMIFSKQLQDATT